ncbi:hypothetical protein ABID42_002649 [Arcicella rosea]|uniref:hypothetical protein n=1 Tax=Arcicella rosea TaxID=502909 RepID=UPI00345CA9AF
MLVEILQDIFRDEANNELLDQIYFLLGEKHKLLIREDDDIEALMESSWYSGLKPSYQKTLEETIVWSIHNSTRIPQCIISGQPNAEYFGLAEAIKYLEQPFTILIENRLNDAPFIDCLIEHFPKESKKIRLFKDERWLKYGMGGGSTILQEIEAELKTFDNPVFIKHKHKYLRYFVLIDSDKKYPEMDLSTGKLNHIAELDKYQIPYHILEKREMENYLPDEAFEEITDNQDFIRAYLALTPMQKDYFDIENGFNNKKFDKLLPEERTFYKALDDSQKNIFRNSNLKKINGSEVVNFKTSFPKLFSSSKVTKINLLKRCEHHSETNHPKDKRELPNLLSKINQLL